MTNVFLIFLGVPLRLLGIRLETRFFSQKNKKYPKITSWEFEYLFNTDRTSNNYYDVNSRGYTSIFANFSDFSFDLEIVFNGLSRYMEHDYRNRNSYDVLLMVYVSFKKVQIWT